MRYAALKGDDQLHLKLFLSKNSMGDSLGHNQSFSGMEEKYILSHRKAACAIQDLSLIHISEPTRPY